MAHKPLEISATTEGAKATIKIIGRIGNWKTNADEFEVLVDSLINQGVKDVHLYIRSGGGNVFDAYEMANLLKRFEGTITGEGGAMVASAATYLACQCDSFTMASNGQYMIHKPMMTVDGNSDEIKANLKALENIEKQYLKTYAKRSGLSEKAVSKLWVVDFWMDCEEAKKKGFIDGETGEEDPITAQDSLDVSAEGYQNIPEAITAMAEQEDPGDGPEATEPTANTANNSNTNKTTSMTFLKQLNGVLKIDSGSSEQDALAKAQAIMKQAETADTLQEENATLTASVKEEKANILVDGAIDAKKITKKVKDKYVALAVADYDTTKTILDDMKPAVKASERLTDDGDGQGEDGPEGRDKWTYQEYLDNDPEALAAMRTKDEAKFEKLAKAHYGGDLKV